MSVIEDIRVDLAAQLGRVLGVTGLPITPKQPAGGTVFVRAPFDRPYLDFAAGDVTSFRSPGLSLDAVVVVPSADYDRVQTWVDERVDMLRAGWSPVFEVGGHRRPAVLSVSSPGLLDAGSQLFAFEVRFTPIQLGEVTS